MHKSTFFKVLIFVLALTPNSFAGKKEIEAKITKAKSMILDYASTDYQQMMKDGKSTLQYTGYRSDLYRKVTPEDAAEVKRVPLIELFDSIHADVLAVSQSSAEFSELASEFNLLVVRGASNFIFKDSWWESKKFPALRPMKAYALMIKGGPNELQVLRNLVVSSAAANYYHIPEAQLKNLKTIYGAEMILEIIENKFSCDYPILDVMMKFNNIHQVEFARDLIKMKYTISLKGMESILDIQTEFPLMLMKEIYAKKLSLLDSGFDYLLKIQSGGQYEYASVCLGKGDANCLRDAANRTDLAHKAACKFDLNDGY